MDRLLLHWEAGLRRLPFFTQRTALLLLGVLVATLAMVGGVVMLVGWPGAAGPLPGRRGRVSGPGPTPAARRWPPRPRRTLPPGRARRTPRPPPTGRRPGRR